MLQSLSNIPPVGWGASDRAEPSMWLTTDTGCWLTLDRRVGIELEGNYRTLVGCIGEGDI